MEIVAKAFGVVEFKLESLDKLMLVPQVLWIKSRIAATFLGMSLTNK